MGANDPHLRKLAAQLSDIGDRGNLDVDNLGHYNADDTQVPQVVQVGTSKCVLGTTTGASANSTTWNRLYGTASARDRATVERLGAVAIDYRDEDFLARVRGLPGRGVDVVLEGLGGAMSIRSFRALRPGGRLVVFGYSSALTQGAGAGGRGSSGTRRPEASFCGGCSCPAGGSAATGSTSWRNRHPEWFREDFLALLELLRRGEIQPVVSERLPLTEARRAHEVLESSAATGKLVLLP